MHFQDLREEINRHHGGEDSRTAIECHHERRRDIEGHSLEKDFDLSTRAVGLSRRYTVPP
jgi:hypothetical protein